jgi:hypothetical protein
MIPIAIAARIKCRLVLCLNSASSLLPSPSPFLCLFHIQSRYPAGMPAPGRNHVQVVRCKGIGCGRNVPTPVEVPALTGSIEVPARTGSITVLCPVCLERRSYIVRRKCSWDRHHGKSRVRCRGDGEGLERQTAISPLAHSLRCLWEDHIWKPMSGLALRPQPEGA